MNTRPSIRLAAALLAAGLLSIIATPAVMAQRYVAYGAPALLTGGTNNVAAATTNSYTSGNVMTLTRQADVAFQISFASVGTNSSTIAFNLSPSVDGNVYDANNDDYSISLVANGTNTVTFVTNLTVGAIGYLRLDSIGNPNASKAITNVTFNYSVKR